MSNEDQRREAALPGVHPAGAWSLAGYHANHRMAELLAEAERERIAGVARSVRHAGPKARRAVVRAGLLHSARSALVGFTRRLPIPRPGKRRLLSADSGGWVRWDATE